MASASYCNPEFSCSYTRKNNLATEMKLISIKRNEYDILQSKDYLWSLASELLSDLPANCVRKFTAIMHIAQTMYGLKMINENLRKRLGFTHWSPVQNGWRYTDCNLKLVYSLLLETTMPKVVVALWRPGPNELITLIVLDHALYLHIPRLINCVRQSLWQVWRWTPPAKQVQF